MQHLVKDVSNSPQEYLSNHASHLEILLKRELEVVYALRSQTSMFSAKACWAVLLQLNLEEYLPRSKGPTRTG